MSWKRWGRTKSGRLFAGAGALTLALGLSGCLKGPPPPPPVDAQPVWNNTTVNAQHAPVPTTGTTTGWITTVTVPVCTDAEGSTSIFGSASNGFVIPLGNNQFSWIRQVTGSPAQRVPGTFTANCTDSAFHSAHPTLSVTVT